MHSRGKHFARCVVPSLRESRCSSRSPRNPNLIPADVAPGRCRVRFSARSSYLTPDESTSPFSLSIPSLLSVFSATFLPILSNFSAKRSRPQDFSQLLLISSQTYICETFWEMFVSDLFSHHLFHYISLYFTSPIISLLYFLSLEFYSQNFICFHNFQ